MHRLSHRTLSRHVSWFMIMALLLSLGIPSTGAFAQGTREIPATVVLPVLDRTGSRDEMLSRRATDALAMALENSGNYRVIATADLNREMKRLDLHPPLSMSEQMRLGEALQAQRVMAATLTALSVDDRTGQVRAELDLRSLDVSVGTVMNGANVSVVTKPIPGFSGEVLSVVNEGLRELSERAVIEMEKTIRAHGTVTLVDDQEVVTTDLGVDSGISIGDRLAVMRGFYLKDQDKVVMRNIGTLEISSAQVRLSTARKVNGALPKIGDRVYPLYNPPEQVRTYKQGRQMTETLRVVAGLALILGITATALGNQNNTPPTADALVFQQAPGNEPVIRVNIHRSNLPDAESTHAYLLFRGATAGFVTTPAALVALVEGGHVNFIEDDTSVLFDIEVNGQFTFFDAQGEEEDGTYDVSYNHFPVVAGNTYYYKLKRVVDPWRPQIPVAEQADDPVDPTIEVDPADALTEASEPTNPVTFSEPVDSGQMLPSGTSVPINPSNPTFIWNPTLGADQYQVQIYNDPLLTQLLISSPVITWTGQTQLSYQFTNLTLPGDQVLYWVVASRTSGEVNPQCQVGATTVPWVLSSKVNFRTVQLPPNPVSAGRGGSGQSSAPSGFWRERRR